MSDYSVKVLWDVCCFVLSITAEDNLLGWFCVEDDGNQIKKEKHPLLVRHMPVMMAKQQEFKVNRIFIWNYSCFCCVI